MDFQQIQGGQQIRVLGLPTFGERHSWFTGAIVGLYFILNRFNLLASLNLLEALLFFTRRVPTRTFCRRGGDNTLLSERAGF